MYNMCFLSAKAQVACDKKRKMLKICHNKYQLSSKEPNIVEAPHSCIQESMQILSDTSNVPNLFKSLDKK